mmetsp:Transcript_69563/g.134223  ORF Transcript_69563/g.134223 Transcript_69563/m.134223 type:complete len:211 (-) Transcript_69563:232-864(-)
MVHCNECATFVAAFQELDLIRLQETVWPALCQCQHTLHHSDVFHHNLQIALQESLALCTLSHCLLELKIDAWDVDFTHVDFFLGQQYCTTVIRGLRIGAADILTGRFHHGALLLEKKGTLMMLCIQIEGHIRQHAVQHVASLCHATRWAVTIPFCSSKRGTGVGLQTSFHQRDESGLSLRILLHNLVGLFECGVASKIGHGLFMFAMHAC